MRLDRLVKTIVDALEDIKGRDIVVLDVRRMTALFDKVIVVSGDSTRQNKALGATVYGVEGTDPGEWVLVDLGAVVVHVMQPAVRQHYNLEELWSNAAPVPRRRAAGGARS